MSVKDTLVSVVCGGLLSLFLVVVVSLAAGWTSVFAGAIAILIGVLPLVWMFGPALRD